MTRKDFERIARGFASVRPTECDFSGNTERYKVWISTVLAVAAELRSDNPRFDMAKFVSACKGA